MSGPADTGQHLFWLASRATGVVALVLVALSVGLGLSLSGRLTRRPGAPALLKSLHEATALTALVAIGVHGLLLIGDGYLRPGLAGILLPFQMADQPAWTGIGITAGWLALILGLSFYARRWIGNAAWRRLHRWTLAVYALAIVHTLGSGTDAGSTWLLALIAITAVPTVFAATWRLLPAADSSARRSARPRVRDLPG